MSKTRFRSRLLDQRNKPELTISINAIMPFVKWDSVCFQLQKEWVEKLLLNPLTQSRVILDVPEVAHGLATFYLDLGSL